MFTINASNAAAVAQLMRGKQPQPPGPLVKPAPQGMPRAAAAYAAKQAREKAEQQEADELLQATMPRAYVDGKLITKQPTPDPTLKPPPAKE